MGILELLTVIFIVLKVIGVISWSWFVVLLPAIIAVTIYVLWFGVFGFIFGSAFRKVSKELKDFLIR